jgi:ankyrin repeat protein
LSEAVIRLLVDWDDVEADSKDMYDRTPLWWVAMNGLGAVVRLLVDRDDVDADSKDINGQTPGWWATELGWEAVVKLLQSSKRLSHNLQFCLAPPHPTTCRQPFLTYHAAVANRIRLENPR